MKQKTSKALSLILAVIFVIALLPTFAFAAENECKIGDNVYATLAEGVAAAQTGDTVVLLRNADVGTTEIEIVGKKITIDMNGFNITGAPPKDSDIFWIKNGGGLVLDNTAGTASTLSVTPIDISVGYNYCVYVGANSTSGNDTFTLKSGVSLTGASSPVVVIKGATANIYGTIEGSQYALSGNGSAGAGETTVNIYDGASLTATSGYAIYHPQTGTLNITGGTLTGPGVLEVKSGAVSVGISGTPVFSATATPSHDPSNNGPSTTGYAVALVENAAYTGNASINIEGGEFTGPIAILQDSASTYEMTLSISGGKFTDIPGALTYAAPGAEIELLTDYEVTENETLEVPQNVTLKVAAGRSLTVNGALYNEGTVFNDGTIESASMLSGNVVNNNIITEPLDDDGVYKVSFETLGGTMNSYGVLDIEESMLELPGATQKGKIFKGWLMDGEIPCKKGEKVSLREGTTRFVADWKPVPVIPDPGPGGGGGGTVTYIITASADEGGKIDPEGNVSVTAGADRAFTITPNAGFAIASVLVDDESVESKDTYTFTNVQKNHTIKVTFAETEMPFMDTPKGEWFYDAVKYCYDNGLMKGVGGNRFSPDGVVTRAEVWQVLANLAGVGTDSGKEPWYTDAQAWAMGVGITDGTNPEATVTREQLVTMLYRYYTLIAKGEFAGGMSAKEFDDFADVSDWAELAIQWGVTDGIIEGSDNKLNPGADASRAELAMMLMRFCEYLKK